MEKQTNTVAKDNMLYNKAFGQHILHNQQILVKIFEKSSIQTTDIVLEIGPGTGNLTALLLQKAKKVICIEIDDRMIMKLKKRFQHDKNLEIIKGDAIKTEFPFFNVCVANTPYQISSPLVFKLLSHRPVYKCAVLMFQQEFAMRCVAKPNSELYCRLSANVQLLAKVDHIMKVGKMNFTPPPQVESSVIRLEIRQPLPQINYKEWDAMLRIVFVRKNKTLGALFKFKKQLTVLYNNYLKFTKDQNRYVDDKFDFQQMADILLEENILDFPQKLTRKERRRLKEKERLDEKLKNVQVITNNTENDYMIEEKEDCNGNQDDHNDDIEDEMEEELDQDEGMKQFKLKVIKVLVDNNLDKVRTKSQSVDDFLKLLYLFNKENIHFF